MYCPIIWLEAKDLQEAECMREDCMWYFPGVEKGECAIAVLAASVQGLDKGGIAVEQM